MSFVCEFPVFPELFIEETYLLLLKFLVPCQIFIHYICAVVFLDSRFCFIGLCVSLCQHLVALITIAL